MFTTMSNMMLPAANHKRKCKFIIDLTPNDWKHLLKS